MLLEHHSPTHLHMHPHTITLHRIQLNFQRMRMTMPPKKLGCIEREKITWKSPIELDMPSDKPEIYIQIYSSGQKTSDKQ